MNNTHIFTSITAVLVFSALALFALPAFTHAYSYVGNPTTYYPTQNTGHYNYSYQNQTQVNQSAYWHYNRYPYTSSYYPNPVTYNTPHCNWSQNNQFISPDPYYYNDCVYYQYTEPLYEYYPQYEYEYVTYYPEYEYYYEYYPQYDYSYNWYGQGYQNPYCWNNAYCDYSNPYYYSI